MYAALAPEMLATEIADYLVRKGVPFREGHHISGRVVALAEEQNVPMDTLSAAQLKGLDARLEEDVKTCFDYKRAVELKDAAGGTSTRKCFPHFPRPIQCDFLYFVSVVLNLHL